MNDFLRQESLSDDESDAIHEPQFGLIDVVEAFTAMRQEWRNQSRETRTMAQTLETSRDDLGRLEQRLVSALAKIQEVAAEATSDDTSRKLAESIAEIDQHLVRVVNATSRATLSSQLRTDAEPLKAKIAAAGHELGIIRRWFCRPVMHRIDAVVNEWVQSQSSRADDAAQQGLQMLVDRVRRLMNDQQIQRVETLGKTFDAETMNAVEGVRSTNEPIGCVVDQLSPAYTWRGKLIRCAQVRIAK